MYKYLLSFLALGMVVFLTGCSSTTNSTENTVTETDTPETTETEQIYTLEEVAQHAIADDCWMVIDGDVYDVTSYGATHPGGDEIYRGCGIDATDYFNDIEGGKGHSTAADAIKENYSIGTLAQ